ncbi:MAG: Nif3-like dinuclear metal center hexameric protein [Turicibacter sp.]|nr:Nif3-like dinuclear metal center hexameric protein [Turicibacter sp.]
MIATVDWIIGVMDRWAPQSWAVDSDNVGLMIGDKTRPVNRILTALDLTESVLEEALNEKFDFIITHHPLFSRHTPPIDRITSDTPLGRKILTLINNNIGVFCAHTNLDVAPGGVNDLLFDLVGLSNKEKLADGEIAPSLGLIGYLSPPKELAMLTKNLSLALNSNVVRYTGSPSRLVHKIGICGGRGVSLIPMALSKKCDAFITGDIDYHLAMNTLEMGMTLIDATHYATEIPIARAIAQHLQATADTNNFQIEAKCTRTNGQMFKSL